MFYMFYIYIYIYIYTDLKLLTKVRAEYCTSHWSYLVHTLLYSLMFFFSRTKPRKTIMHKLGHNWQIDFSAHKGQ